MADVNKVILIGRLTRDPEMRTFCQRRQGGEIRFRRRLPPQEPADRAVGRRRHDVHRLQGVQSRRIRQHSPT